MQIAWRGISKKCNLTLTICIDDIDTAYNGVEVHSIDEEFYADGANDPVYLETSYFCNLCPDCILRVITASDAVTDSGNLMCSEVERTETLTVQHGDISFTYKAIFTNHTAAECITITQYRVYIPVCRLPCSDDRSCSVSSN